MSRPRILCVDNDPMMLEYLIQLLEGEGYEVSLAEDGLAALRAVDSFMPDILITDLIMPYVDGAKLARVLRSRPEFSKLFIIALSAVAKEQQFDFAENGVDLLVAKGPLRDMKPHILRAIETAQSMDGSSVRHETLGAEGVHRRIITSELLSEIRRYEALFDRLAEGVVVTAANHHVVALNSPAEMLLGATEVELLGRPLHDERWVPIEMTKELAETLPDGGREWQMYRIDAHIVLVARVHVRDELQDTELVILRDVTAHHAAQAALQETLSERSLMLEELNHRVKNNVQTILSLINLRIATLPDGNARSVMQTFGAQVRAVDLVHQRIFRTSGQNTVEFGAYARDLLNNLSDLFDAGRRVTASVESVEVSLTSTVLVPLGLIVTELASNSYRHAFGGVGAGGVVEGGTISVTMSRVDAGAGGVSSQGGEGTTGNAPATGNAAATGNAPATGEAPGPARFLLTYEDSGSGFGALAPVVAAAFRGEDTQHSSLGVQILYRLARQLRGSIRLDQAGGSRVVVEFEVSG